MSAWSAVARGSETAHGSFLRSLGECELTQRRQLEMLLAVNAGCEFGRRYDLRAGSDPDRFRAAVPLHGYEDLAGDIHRMAEGARGVLMAEPVRLFEQTGGSCGPAKLIPYSDSSLAGFRRAVHPWLHDLARQYPRLGRSYFAVSPAARPPGATPGGTPVGADSDWVYFGPVAGALAPLAVAPGAAEGLDSWRRATLLALLKAADLTLFSVWSPTFLTALLEALPAHAEDLLRELHQGTAAERERAAVVGSALAGGVVDTRALWPDLQLISTWTHGGAARFIPQLRQLFPHATIQGKGLLGTEGAVSIPLAGHEYPVLAVESGFYEFLDGAGRSHLAHEVAEGGEYEVVMSVPGLYRYRSGDRVKVRGWAGRAPQLEFLGRAGLVSDLVGEKLTDAFAADCLRDIEGFAMIAPELEPRPGYRLYLERSDACGCEQVERLLRRNPQYAYARDLGQLEAMKVVAVERPLERYEAWALARGQRLGEIKPPSLRPETGWGRRLSNDKE